MVHAALRAKAQTTVPRAVREALGIGEGDLLAWAIEGNRAVVTRVANPVDPFDNPFALFTEWADDLDSVYDNL